MVLDLLVKESLIINKYEELVKLHEKVIIENEKTLSSIPEFCFVLNRFFLIHFFNGLIKVVLLKFLEKKIW